MQGLDKSKTKKAGEPDASLQEGVQLSSPASPGHEPHRLKKIGVGHIVRNFVVCLTVSATEWASMAASGYQRPASLLKIFGSGLTLCSGPKQVARGSVRRAIQPSLGAARWPSSRNLPGAQTEHPSGYNDKHPFGENKGPVKLFLRKNWPIL